MIFWRHRYANGEELHAHVADDGELILQLVGTSSAPFLTSLPRGAVEELKQFLTMKGF